MRTEISQMMIAESGYTCGKCDETTIMIVYVIDQGLMEEVRIECAGCGDVKAKVTRRGIGDTERGMLARLTLA